jgi:acyl-CoA dehydrogenase
VTLTRVPVAAASDVLPGDGYDDYVKPFRTVEDVHVHAALIGYLLGVTRRIHAPREIVEQLLATALAVRALAGADPRSPATHVALAGVLTQSVHVMGLVERAWEDVGEGDEWTRWQRDRPLLRVAGAARSARRDKAWQQLSPA